MYKTKKIPKITSHLYKVNKLINHLFLTLLPSLLNKMKIKEYKLIDSKIEK